MTEIIIGQILFLCCTLLLGLVLGRLTGIDDSLTCLVDHTVDGVWRGYFHLINTGAQLRSVN